MFYLCRYHVEMLSELYYFNAGTDLTYVLLKQRNIKSAPLLYLKQTRTSHGSVVGL